jgi:hypothetical protein
MCFSSGASFAGGVIISLIGVATVKKAHKSSQIIFASIPLLFGVQQFAEGFLWLTLPDPDPQLFFLRKICTYIFMITAQVIWPLMIPFSVLSMEKNTRRRKILTYLVICGTIVSLYYIVCQLFLHVDARIEGYHILYKTDFPESLSNPVFLIYLVATITPLFVSTQKKMRIMAILMILSCLLTAIFCKEYLTSVWCFFAALISIVIYWILIDSERAFALKGTEELQMG